MCLCPLSGFMIMSLCLIYGNGDVVLQTCNDLCENDSILQGTSKGLFYHGAFAIDCLSAICFVCGSIVSYSAVKIIVVLYFGKR